MEQRAPEPHSFPGGFLSVPHSPVQALLGGLRPASWLQAQAPSLCVATIRPTSAGSSPASISQENGRVGVTRALCCACLPCPVPYQQPEVEDLGLVTPSRERCAGRDLSTGCRRAEEGWRQAAWSTFMAFRSCLGERPSAPSPTWRMVGVSRLRQRDQEGPKTAVALVGGSGGHEGSG